MEEKFKILSSREKRKLSIDELCTYNRRLRKYLVDINEEIKGIDFTKKIHPLITFLIKTRRIIAHQNLKTYNSVPKNLEQSIIFAITHTGKFDIEIVNEAIELLYYLLSDDEEYMYRTIDGYITDKNGVIYVDSDFPEDKKVAKETMIKILNQGGNVMWFPEGIWNLSPNLLVLPCQYGIVEVAVRTNSVIIPIAIDQRKKDFIVNIGDCIYPERFKLYNINDVDQKIRGIDMLRDKLATLKWEIWEKFPIESRDSLPDDYYDKFVKEKIAEWPFLTKEDIDKRVFKPKNILTSEDVYEESIDAIKKTWDYYEVNGNKVLKREYKKVKTNI